jgi:hypothetical protein
MEKFKIIIGSPVDYNDIVVYIKIEGEYVAILSKEEGIDNIKVNFYKKIINKNICLSALIEALDEAKNELLK